MCLRKGSECLDLNGIGGGVTRNSGPGFRAKKVSLSSSFRGRYGGGDNQQGKGVVPPEPPATSVLAVQTRHGDLLLDQGNKWTIKLKDL